MNSALNLKIKSIILIIFCICCTIFNTLLSSSILNATESDDIEIRNTFKKGIVARNFVCDSCDEVVFIKTIERGDLFKVYCNGKSLIYRIIIMPNNRYTATPWNE
jgi:hypothetical protein